MDLVIVNLLEYSTAQMGTSVGGQMEHAVESNDTRQRGAAPHEIPAAQIQEALAEILVSVPFRSSKQSQQLLRYIVDQTLSGHGQLLKERVIGADVFGRRPDYDTNSDPIVRARAAELRKRLAQFYVGPGANSRRPNRNQSGFLSRFVFKFAQATGDSIRERQRRNRPSLGARAWVGSRRRSPNLLPRRGNRFRHQASAKLVTLGYLDTLRPCSGIIFVSVLAKESD